MHGRFFRRKTLNNVVEAVVCQVELANGNGRQAALHVPGKGTMQKGGRSLRRAPLAVAVREVISRPSVLGIARLALHLLYRCRRASPPMTANWPPRRAALVRRFAHTP